MLQALNDIEWSLIHTTTSLPHQRLLLNIFTESNLTFLELFQESKCLSLSLSSSWKIERCKVLTIVLKMVKWSRFLVSERLDLWISIIRATIILEPYRRKWQGGNINTQSCLYWLNYWCSKYGMLHHSLGGAIIFISLQHFILPYLTALLASPRYEGLHYWDLLDR